MSPVPVAPRAVPQASVRRLESTAPAEAVPVQRVAVRAVPAATAIPRQVVEPPRTA